MKKRLLIALVVVVALALSVSPATANTTCTTINATIQLDGSIIATGNGFEVAYCEVTPTAGAPYAIYNAGFSGSIHHNTANGGYHGILVDSGSTTPNPAIYVKIAYNDVQGFTKTGILNGRYPPSNAGITGDIANNTVIDTASNIYARNGIAVECGGVGTVMGNSVSSVWYTGDFWTATGILLFEVQGVTVRGNTVSSCQTGIAAGSFGWTGPADNNHIVGNRVQNADWGVSLQAVAFSATDFPQTNNNKVVNNTISSSTTKPFESPLYFAGIEIFLYGYTDNATAENNKIIANSISGYDQPINDGGTATKVQANVTP